ncbi:hypothetical protein B0H14DRAFT_2702228 [Mycena olivaceomarginata]|nr:hypothetical protein B0H14DRAFT_2702228 [Mycena olivaceomarginata]
MSVGNIAELRQLIFSYANFTDIARCARVCSAWTDDAQHIVWRELPSPHLLLELVDESSLCPTMAWRSGVGHATISKPVRWARFHRTAVHVRKMWFTQSAASKDVLERLALMKALCPDLPLLPNLEEITVLPSSQILWVPVVALFLHSGVRRLQILPPDSDGPSFFTYPPFFAEVLLRAPLLESLEIGECSMLTFNRVWRDEDATILASYATQFPRLTHFSAPPSVVAALEDIPTALPHLRVLHELSALRPKIAARDYRLVEWTTPLGSALEDLALTATCASALELLTANRLPSLRILCLEAPMQIAAPQAMASFLRALSTRCTALQELTIKCVGHGLFPSMVDQIHVSEFEPLADCESLAVLDLSGPCALTFETDAQLAAILPPHLRVCRVAFRPSPSLEALIPLAARCRQLEELSVVLDPTVPANADTGPIDRFSPVFRKLSIGHYVGAQGWDAPAVARYLARFLPQDCSVGLPRELLWSGRWIEQEEIAKGRDRLKEAFELVHTFL